jgi:lysophospholipase L1-like esterase
MSPCSLIFQSLFASLATAVLSAMPTLYLIGDSTVRNNTAGQQGWGEPLAAHFNPATMRVANRAIGGRSSKTFLTEGRWDAVLAELKPGDFLIIQFGHNDGGGLNEPRGRASIKGIGEETATVVRDGKEQTVHSYGWYLRKYISDAKARGAIPIVASPVPRNIWKEGRISRDGNTYSLWARQAAEAAGAAFIPLHDLVADAYDKLGPDATKAMFCEQDHTHTSPDGARFTARTLADAIRSLNDIGLSKYLIPGK